MRTIYKYPLYENAGDPAKPGRFTLEMPSAPGRNPTFISIRVQNGVPTMWFQVERDMPMAKQHFYLAWTGFDIPDELMGLRPLGSYEDDHGLVGHVYIIGQHGR